MKMKFESVPSKTFDDFDQRPPVYLPLPGTPLFWKEPSRLDDGTKNALRHWAEKRKLDGWWEEQEVMAWKIVEWRDQGLVGTQIHPVRCSLSNRVNAEIQD